MENAERYNRGWKKLKQIDAEAGENVIESLKDISPELGRFIIEYAFGDVYSNNKLSPNLQEIAVVAILSSLGCVGPQLKVHLNAALNVGCTINELKELILQMVLTSGFPKGINAMLALKDVLQERKEKGIIDTLGEPTPKEKTEITRYQKGKNVMYKMDPEQFELLNNAYGEIAPELLQYILEFGYGDVITRTNLSPQKRQIAIIASMAALGNVRPQLKVHINIGLNLGLSVENIKEILLLLSAYAGFPASTNGINILRKVLAEKKEKNKK